MCPLLLNVTFNKVCHFIEVCLILGAKAGKEMCVLVWESQAGGHGWGTRLWVCIPSFLQLDSPEWMEAEHSRESEGLFYFRHPLLRPGWWIQECRFSRRLDGSWVCDLLFVQARAALDEGGPRQGL